jgi:YfiH family protein
MKKHILDIEFGYFIEKKGDTIPLFNQVHGNEILVFDELCNPTSSLGSNKDADGAFCALPQAELHVYTADCLPLLFFTERRDGPICAVHAGWRGVKLGIAAKALSRFAPKDKVHVALGPSIGPCCFSVREDFISDWEASHLNPQGFLLFQNSKMFFDLWKFLKENDLKLIPEDRLHLDLHRCTACSLPTLPSFRRNKTGNPRIRSWIKKLH